MTKILYSVLSPVLGKKNFQFFFELLYMFSLAGMNYGQVVPGKSGESSLLKFIKSKLASKKRLAVIDIGANKGEFTALTLKYLGKKTDVYAIEPLTGASNILRKKFLKNKNVKIFKLAFSDRVGRSTIYYDDESSELASLYQRTFKQMSLPVELNKKEIVMLTTLDEFCLKNRVEYIDLLKIDAEGNELKILRGSKRLLKDNKISFIQFEFGGTMIDSRTFFRDIFQLLSNDFAIYRILQDGLKLIEKYSEKQEIFIIGNFLAIRKTL